ncbi:predicted protein [Sclerotinia sclerotiorum 1980 UF-70]|uniref:Uncharacterized protein n=1 Tax=Sclerotinia sclerotiorum (strain ATCC 18683 / 1980 / Ss-1) TaxID=665079 RepID=A7EQX9_SCLS1|nr:predicted protein [Sclerotinia sclerotiorum 1980 UF-70]EDN91871.1 predicted protein [Sclerotinia sclerotiorum 1980 UF-70]
MAGKFQSCHDFGFVGGPVLAQRCRWSDHSDVKNSNKSGEVIRVVRMREGCQYGYGYGYCNMYGVIPTSVWYDDGVEIVPIGYRTYRMENLSSCTMQFKVKAKEKVGKRPRPNNFQVYTSQD